MSEVINTEKLEKDILKLDGKIKRKALEIRETPGMSPFMQEKRIRLMKELRNLQYERIDLLKLFDKI